MVNLSRERENLRTKFDAHIIEGVLIINGDQANRQSEVPKPPRPANSMEVRLRITREIKVDYDIYRLDVNPTGAEVGGDKIPTISITILIHIQFIFTIQIQFIFTIFYNFISHSLSNSFYIPNSYSQFQILLYLFIFFP